LNRVNIEKTKKKIMKIKFCLLLSVFLISSLPSFSYGEKPPAIKAKHLYDITADFCHPSDLSVGPDGRIHILDGTNNRVVIYNPVNKQISSFKINSKQNVISHPLGIDVASNGDIYIADSGNHCIRIFTPEGKVKNTFKLNSNNTDPTDIVTDLNLNRCYVIDNDNHRILVYDLKNFNLIDTWGESGEKPGEFQYPFLAAKDSTSTLYVVDVLNTRVQAINPEGRTMATLGKWGVNAGQFYRPKGVTIDKKDQIYVSDSYLGVIQVFKRYRKFLGVLTDESGNLLKLKTPTGIGIDKTQKLYIVEMIRNCVSVYQIIE